MIVAVGLAVCAVAVFISTWREAKQRRTRNRCILDACTSVFDESEIMTADDGFARFAGRIGRQRFIVSLIPDSLTIKRLPQLWLSISMPVRSSQSRIAITARPRPDDFYSAASSLHARHDVPDWLPYDLAIRSETEACPRWIDDHRETLRRAFGDPLLKEVAVGPTGTRLIYRLAEGDRGRHLLFRQSSFDATLTPSLVRDLLTLLTSFASTASPDLERAA